MHTIKLTDTTVTNGGYSRIYVNPARIAWFQAIGGATTICIDAGVFLTVKETPQEIDQALVNLGQSGWLP